MSKTIDDNDDLYADMRDDWRPPHGAAIAITVLVCLGLIGAITMATLIWFATP